ncbi:uncharacterized protein EMH_0082650 [Eimeria mitis]|uniref:Uncharacterized protein n=1 Tax=Eimeria mitis TaxID=44415 RepID=U6KHX4_9EIME|nr:uncharacterized protein EMH_0082650 [Eimeria mitis]CDJ36381.1 hypothetical protein EMH_0082650 [Eimeria mitis]
MPVQHSILQDITSSDAPAAAPAGLPTLESIFTRSENLRGSDSRSAPCLRVVLAAFASISAVVLLVLFCSRVYGRRALQSISRRRLASPEDSDEEVDVCGFSSDEDEESQYRRPRFSLPAGEEKHLPIKKRLLTRAAEPAIRGTRRSIFVELRKLQRQMGYLQRRMYLLQRQQRQQRQLQLKMRQFQQQMYLPQHHQTKQKRRTGEFQQQMHLLQQQQQRQQWQTPRYGQHRQQQQDHFQQMQEQHDLYQERQHMFWEQRQQHYLLQPQQQPVIQEQVQRRAQQHLMQQQEQQQLFEVPEPEHVTRDHEQHQNMLQDEQQGSLEEMRKQQRDQRKPCREQQEELEPPPKEQRQLLQHADPLAEELMVDEWTEPESPSSEVPQPSISQQALQPPSAPAASGPSINEYFRMQVTPGFVLAARDASRAASSRASRDEDAAAFAAGAAVASAPGTSPSAGMSSAASAKNVGVTRSETPTLSSLLVRQRSEGVITASAARRAAATAIRAAAAGGTAAGASGTVAEAGEAETTVAGTGAAAAGKGAKAAEAGASAISHLLETPPATMLEHPFVRQDLTKDFACRAVVRLGIRFLVLDAIVSIFSVLEQTPEEKHWKLVADAVSHAVPDAIQKSNVLELTNFSLSLCQKLSSAIQILKTGRRPVAAELIRIKQMLFCSPLSPRRFRNNDFDAWRRQCDGRIDGP